MGSFDHVYSIHGTHKITSSVSAGYRRFFNALKSVQWTKIRQSSCLLKLALVASPWTCVYPGHAAVQWKCSLNIEYRDEYLFRHGTLSLHVSSNSPNKNRIFGCHCRLSFPTLRSRLSRAIYVIINLHITFCFYKYGSLWTEFTITNHTIFLIGAPRILGES